MDRMELKRRRLRYDPLYFFQKVMGIKLSPSQARILEEIRKGNRIAIACPRIHGRRFIEELWERYQKLVDGSV